MKRISVVIGVLVIAISGLFPAVLAAQGQPAAAMPPALRPWQDATELLLAARAVFAKGGVQALGPRIPDLERALAQTDRTRPWIAVDGTVYVFTDGSTEATAVAAAAAAVNKIPGVQERTVRVVANPYPPIATLLGYYYNDAGRPADALRVLDAALALPPSIPGIVRGDSVPNLIGERGAALLALERWADAFAAFDDGLRSPYLIMSPAETGRLLRGRGMALTELGLLDDAESSYRESLKIEPADALAQKELDYIARLRAGTVPSRARLVAPDGAKPE